jgi:hypothetical protein
MKSHLGLDAAVKPETVPEETVLAVAEVLRRSPVLRVSEDGNPIPSLPFPFFLDVQLPNSVVVFSRPTPDNCTKEATGSALDFDHHPLFVV